MLFFMKKVGSKAAIFVGSLLIAFCVLAPASLHATTVTSISWILIDPNSGEPRYDVPYTLEDNGTHAVPFDASGFLTIEADFAEGCHSAGGEVFFIPNLAEPDTRVPVGPDYDFEWEQEGVYEIDIYDNLMVPTLSPWDRFFSWLLPTAHAQEEDPYHVYVETIRFTITEGPLPDAPCCSSVLFLPGIQGSALREGDDLRWPSTVFSGDVARLDLSEDGRVRMISKLQAF